jgi:hypothetical protein
MKKNLASKLRTGAMIGLAGLALGATAPKAKAEPHQIVSFNTSIYDSVDMDSSRLGDQIRIDWTIQNDPDGDYTQDALWRLTFNDADLEARGMYNHTNSGTTQWNYTAQEDGYFQTPGAQPIRPSATKTFSAFFDKTDVLGYEQKDAFATSSNGSSQLVQLSVPIPEPLTIGMLASGALALLAGRRVRENYKYR